MIQQPPHRRYRAHHSHSHHQTPIFCANCGGIGHIYKNCNHPVTSYGIICYRMIYDHLHNIIRPEYLMVQRKDSMSYVEFIRGKYALENRSYIIKLLSHMTTQEHAALRTMCFEDLWKKLWQVHECKNFIKEYQEAKLKFETLQKGYMLTNAEGGQAAFFDLAAALDAAPPLFTDTEWGFPKGRRNINEDDLTCAVREFCEETGYLHRNIHLVKDCKPLEEVFNGTNKVRYKHVYYLATFVPERLIATQPHLPFASSSALSASSSTISDHMMRVMMKEIKDVKWFDYHTAQNNIRAHNVERKELFKRVNQMVVKNCCFVAASAAAGKSVPLLQT